MTDDLDLDIADDTEADGDILLGLAVGFILAAPCWLAIVRLGSWLAS